MVTDKDMIFSGPGVEVETDKSAKVIIPESRKIETVKQEIRISMWFPMKLDGLPHPVDSLFTLLYLLYLS